MQFIRSFIFIIIFLLFLFFSLQLQLQLVVCMVMVLATIVGIAKEKKWSLCALVIIDNYCVIQLFNSAHKKRTRLSVRYFQVKFITPRDTLSNKFQVQWTLSLILISMFIMNPLYFQFQSAPILVSVLLLPSI